MQIENHSRLALSYQSSTPPGRPEQLYCQVVAKVLGEWDRRGRWRFCWELDPPFFQAPEQTPWGCIAADFHLPKAGCDVVALGRVYSPDPRGSRRSEVALRVNEEQRELLVFGPRYWKAGVHGLVASNPEYFSIVELSWEESFGGRCQDAQGNTQCFAFNPGGRGFQVSMARARNQFLPRFEDPSCPIRSFDDQPRPCNLKMLEPTVPLSLYPDPLPLCQALTQGRRIKLPRDFHNIAHPRFRFSQIGAGSSISLQGMLEDQVLHAKLPDARYILSVQLGDRHRELELRASTIQFFPETRQCSISFSAHFCFRWVPKELRRLQLRAQEVFAV